MRQKIVVMFLLAALLVTTGPLIAWPGEDSDSTTAVNASGWETPCAKEGGEEGILNSYPIGKEPKY